jgi:hypothetical protein
VDARNIGTFVLGLCTGVGVAANWRTTLRRSMRHTIVASAYLSRSALRYAEDLSDAIHEARFRAGGAAVPDVWAGLPLAGGTRNGKSPATPPRAGQALT